jgi:hypothetical protein
MFFFWKEPVTVTYGGARRPMSSRLCIISYEYRPNLKACTGCIPLSQPFLSCSISVFTHSDFRIQGSKRYRIPDPQHCQ